MEANTIDSQESTNIQLGIKFFVPKSVEKENANMNKKKTKKVQVAAEASFEKKKNSRHPSSTLKRKRELSTLETEEPDSFAESTELLPTDTKKKKFSGTKECVPCEDEGVNETTVLKRSPKRKKQVPKAQKNKNSNTLVSKTNGNNKVAALDYLCQWEKDRSSWAFRKKTQYWLLQNALDKSEAS